MMLPITIKTPFTMQLFAAIPKTGKPDNTLYLSGTTSSPVR
jgi:hypothetical protein